MLLALLMSYELAWGESSKDQTPGLRKAPEGSPLDRIGASEIASRGTGPPPMNPKLGSSNPSPLVPSSSAMGGEEEGRFGGKWRLQRPGEALGSAHAATIGSADREWAKSEAR